MTETVPVANYRTKLEAEFAASVLAGADIPYVIQSMEGLLHGPLGPGATILVRAEDAGAARELLAAPEESPAHGPLRAMLVGRYPEAGDAETAQQRLTNAGIPFLLRPGPPAELFVRREHARRAREILAPPSA